MYNTDHKFKILRSKPIYINKISAEILWVTENFYTPSSRFYILIILKKNFKK